MNLNFITALRSFFRHKSEADPAKPSLMVVEGVESVWSYHLAPSGAPFEALCGRRTMRTSIPLSAWGVRLDHIPEKWCSKCAALSDGQSR